MNNPGITLIGPIWLPPMADIRKAISLAVLLLEQEKDERQAQGDTRRFTEWVRDVVRAQQTLRTLKLQLLEVALEQGQDSAIAPRNF